MAVRSRKPALAGTNNASTRRSWARERSMLMRNAPAPPGALAILRRQRHAPKRRRSSPAKKNAGATRNVRIPTYGFEERRNRIQKKQQDKGENARSHEHQARQGNPVAEQGGRADRSSWGGRVHERGGVGRGAQAVRLERAERGRAGSPLPAAARTERAPYLPYAPWVLIFS